MKGGRVLSPDDAMDGYKEGMQEARLRLATISGFVQGIEESDTPLFDIEYSFLHLRLACEIIALGSFMVHNPHSFSKKYLSKYGADDIFAMIQREKPDSFPRAVEFARDGSDGNRFDWRRDKDVDLPTFRTIYQNCADVLHRHNMKGVLKRKNKEYDLGGLRDANIKLSTWLSQHVILIDGYDDALRIDMFGGPNGAVSVDRMTVHPDEPSDSAESSF